MPRTTAAYIRRTLSMGLCCLMLSHVACRKNASLSPAQSEQQQLAWNLKTTVYAYENVGSTNAAWDDSAHLCLSEFARARANEPGADESSAEIISTNAAAAVEAGCDDPMVNYLFIRYSLSQTNSKQTFLAAFMKTARDMNNSGYSPERKFYATARTLDQIYYTYGTNTHASPEIIEIFPILMQLLKDALADPTIPGKEAYEIGNQAMSLMGRTNDYQNAYDIVEPVLSKRWPDAYTTWYLKGNYYVKTAWDARGDGYVDTITPEGAKLFSDRLAMAQKALEHAWELDPKPEVADVMMTVMLGQGGGRDRMELWFDRAMKADTNNYYACQQKLNYLEPKWYGSDEDQLAFGRECVQSTNWGGRVPLILVDAHEHINFRNAGEVQANYWKQPEVWADIQAAFDRFFELNPDTVSWYHNYALYAYRAEQWNKLNELLPKLGPVNYAYFGGKEEFDKMVRLAKEHSSSN